MIATLLAAVLAASPEETADSKRLRLASGGELFVAEATRAETGAVAALSAGGVDWTLPGDQVVPAGPRDPTIEAYSRRAPRTADAIDAQWELAQWCRTNGLTIRRKLHLERILALDADHAEAQRALGYQRVDDRWLTREERIAQQGLVRYNQRYVSSEEFEDLQARDAFAKQENVWRRKLRIQMRNLGGRQSHRAEAAIRAAAADPAAATPLFEWFLETTDFQVRLLLLDVLGEIDTENALGALISVAVEEENGELRATSIDHLQRRSHPAIGRRLVAALADEDDAYINSAARALGEIGVESAIPALIDALVIDRKREVVDEGPEFNVGFTPNGGGGIGAGRLPTRIVVEAVQNQEVLDALVELTEQNYGFDVAAWRAWQRMRRPDLTDVDLRRDDP